MRLGGIVDISTKDIPGRSCMVIFTVGCNFKCEFCHNKYLLQPNVGREYEITEIIDKISTNLLVNGVSITGGEPTLQEDLFELCKEIQKIDSLFISWNQPNHPGGSVGIMKEGKIIFSRAYGLASLEYLVPNSPDTRFNIASVSKQFTCMGIVLLYLRGKLSLDDDVRKHLPELPFFEDTITIRHLIHHTSGMRSLHALLGMAGWRGDDSRTNEDLFRFMKNN